MKRISIFRRVSRIAKFHWLAWLAMLLTAVPLVLIIVPGDFTYPWPDETGELNAWKIRSNEFREQAHEDHKKEFKHRATSLTVYEHGWPMPFLARAVVCNCNDNGQTRSKSKPRLGVKSWFLHWGGSRYLSVSWSSYDNWPFYSNDWIVNTGGLLIDTLVALAIVISVGAVTHWWVTKRAGRFWTFGLRELIVLMVILAIGLGVHRYHTRIRMSEGLAPQSMAPGFKLHDGHMTVGQRYCGPVWIRKLAGNRYYPQLFHHVTNAAILDNEKWNACYDELLSFPYLNSLYSRAAIPIAAFDQLERCRELKHLRLEFSAKPIPLRTQPSTPTISVDELHLLERLSLETIHLYGDEIDAGHVEQLAALPELKRIQLQGTSADPEKVEAIRRRFPTVTIEILTDWAKLLGSG